MNIKLQKYQLTLYRFASICLLVLLIHNSLAIDLPVKLDCKDNICSCKQKESFNIDSVLKLNYQDIRDKAKLACLYHKIAVDFYIGNKYERAIHFYTKANNLRKQFNDGWLWKSQMGLAVTYFYALDFNQSIENFNLAINQTGHPKRPKDSLLIYQLLAQNYSYIGEVDKAIQFSKKATKVNAETARVRIALDEYAEILIETRDSLNIIKGILCLDSIYEVNAEDNNFENLSLISIKLGNAYNYLNEPEKAVQKYTLALDYTDDEREKAIILRNIATVFIDQNEYSSAKKYLKKSLGLNKSYQERKFHYDYAAVHENFGDCYLKQNMTDSAVICYQKAIINLTNNFRETGIFNNPNPNDTSLLVLAKSDLIQVLHLKATAAFKHYEITRDENYLNLAKQTYQTLFSIHNQLQNEISTENSRLFQVENIIPYIEKALQVAHEQQINGTFRSDAAFRFMEKSKATVLLQAINESEALQYANLPDSLLKQKKYLKTSISIYNKQLNEAIEYEDTLEIDRLEKMEFEVKQAYDRLIDNLETNYTDYYQLKYQQNTTTLKEIQDALQAGVALLEYFIGDENIYILSIQKESAQLFQLNKPHNWKATIEDLRQSLTNSSQRHEPDPQFVESSTQLYKWLIKEVSNNLDKEITSLQIIPDGVLNYIPFEVLLTKPGTSVDINYKTLPYLLKEKAIGYSYSAALWFEQIQKQQSKKSEISYAGFAPKYRKLFNLPFAKQSVQENANLFNGKAFIKEEATAQQFETSVAQFNLLQLAMHVIINNDKPMETYMQFSQTNDSVSHKLRAADLYNIKLDADLAVLGACNTGTGQLQNGEGVMSLSRAFTYSGCSSLMMSLWSIVDESTATVVNRFFRNLKQGKSKHIALQQAKLDFLKNAPPTQVHPRYWAGLVISGNQQAIVKKVNYTLWALPFIFAAFIGLFFFILKNKI